MRRDDEQSSWLGIGWPVICMDDRSPNINGYLRTNHICNGVRLCSEPAVIKKAIARADAFRLESLVAVSLTKEISY